MKPKAGCLFIYSIFLILFGMGLYKYRTEIINYLSQKYNDITNKATGKIEEAKGNLKEGIE